MMNVNGGSWYYYAGNCRSAGRDSFDPDGSGNALGFRLVRDL